MEFFYIIYHGSLYHDMNIDHDIDKSDEVITIAMSWEAYDNIIVCYEMIIKCKMSENLI